MRFSILYVHLGAWGPFPSERRASTLLLRGPAVGPPEMAHWDRPMGGETSTSTSTTPIKDLLVVHSVGGASASGEHAQTALLKSYLRMFTRGGVASHAMNSRGCPPVGPTLLPRVFSASVYSVQWRTVKPATQACG